MPRATVCLTVDFDAVSPWIHVGDGRNTPTNRSRGRFGAEVGAPRLLDLFDRYDLPTTWFIPGHTVESYPGACGDVVDDGHEVQHHGWSHTPPGDYDSREEERADIERGIDALRDLTGERPDGYRSPSWDYSEHTVDLLADLDFAWSSSGMARDFEPYQLREEHADPDRPYALGDEVGVLEIPVSWQRDDYPPFAYSGNHGFADERAVFNHWRRQFDWMYDDVDGGVFVLTMHPQVMGQSARLDLLAEFVEDAAGKPGVAFRSVGDVAADHL